MARRFTTHLSLFLLLSALAGCPAAPNVDDAGPGGVDASEGDGGVRRDAGACLSNDDCDDDLFCTDRERCVDGRCTFQETFCDDGVDCTTDSCSEDRRRCENVAPDADDDGSRDASCFDYRGVPLGDDCDDTDPMRFPSNLEVCDEAGHDEDCDLTTFGGVDVDTDGYESSACCQHDATGTLRCGTDCDDDVGSTHPLAGEICNGLDDDCDELDDDIIHGTVLCEHEQTRPCTTSCDLAGTEVCNAACLGWDVCTADEVCNGCDDDNDAAQDEDFECALGTSRACTTTCGTAGTQLCGSACTYAQCAAPEACNYCDDDGDGNALDERSLATFTATDSWRVCAASGGAFCHPDILGSGTVAELLNGTANDQSGAIWLDAGTTMGWGAVDLEVTMEVSGRSLGGSDEIPLGGWAIVVGRGATGAGTPENMGIPTTIHGVAAQWFWTNFDTCSFGPLPISNDAIRATQLAGASFRPLVTPEDAIPGMIEPLIRCRAGYGLGSGSTTFDAPAHTRSQRMRISYRPDDPTTTTVDEELMTVTATAGATTTTTAVPADAIPVGSGPIRIGITAGSYTDPLGGFTDVGMPVRARVIVHRFDSGCPDCGIDEYPITVSYAGSCPR